jgi:hypothetical protein
MRRSTVLNLPLQTVLLYGYRDPIVNIERANMHCQGIACTRSVDTGLTSAEGQKLKYLKLSANYIFTSKTHY